MSTPNTYGDQTQDDILITCPACGRPIPTDYIRTDFSTVEALMQDDKELRETSSLEDIAEWNDQHAPECVYRIVRPIVATGATAGG